MKEDNLRFRNPATARAYIRSLADQFGELEEMVEFLRACDIAQAALAYWITEECRYDYFKQIQSHKNNNDKKSHVGIESNNDAHSKASKEFELSKNKLKILIKKIILK
ncbi:MAG: hypothetical protein HXX11_18440 [Desulfuromonadales bacterium]|nr:hypothetical protein [Desulfuromonadales bacterium]